MGFFLCVLVVAFGKFCLSLEQKVDEPQVLHAMVVAFENVWSLFEYIVDELTSR